MENICKYFTDFTDRQMEQFSSLKPLYIKWNEKINVISRKDIEFFYEHHVLHSLSIATQFNFPSGFQIMDLGSGGGFPGIPLAIFYPNVNFVLVDSINKKLNVVKEVCIATGIKNVTTINSRVEDLKNKTFDIIISRAVAPLNTLWLWSRPLLRKNKKGDPSGLICLKGGDLSKEICESELKPRVWEIRKIFNEHYFNEKYILNIPLSQ